MTLERSLPRQGYGQVQCRLSSKSGEQTLWPLAGNYCLNCLHGKRLQIDSVGDLGVSHDGGRIGVDQNGPNALGPQGPTGLGACVVKLCCLANDQRDAS